MRFHDRKSGGFTLIELLVVIAIIAILMAVVFRLAGLGTDASKRANTVMKMQKLQNCLSGYYSAFGSYPPVKLHGSRDINVKITLDGGDYGGGDDYDENATIEQVMDESGNYAGEDSGGGSLRWPQVCAACRSQPVGAYFPFRPELDQRIQHVAEKCMERHQDTEYNRKHWPNHVKRAAYAYKFDGVGTNPGRFNAIKHHHSWGHIKLFKFGLMSYLLPRYAFMLYSQPAFYDGSYAQWEQQNIVPDNPFTGENLESWNNIRSKMDQVKGGGFGMSMLDVLNCAPSQRACARWMPNLEKIVRLGNPGKSAHKFFGINVSENSADLVVPINPGIYIAKAGGQQYTLDFMTVYDGWGREFYYYSKAPYQSYSLWSSGPDGHTFPPWIPLDSMTGSNAETAGGWLADDLIGLSH